LTDENLRKILAILKFYPYDKVTMNLGKTYEEVRKITKSIENRARV